MKTPYKIKKDREYKDPVKDILEIQEIFKMMGNYYRLKILIVLNKQNNLTLDQINGLVGGGFANISAHTKKLESAGLIIKKYHNNFVLHSLTLDGKRSIKALRLFNYSIE